MSYVGYMKGSALAFILLAGCDATHAPVPAHRPDDHEARSAKEPKPSVRLVDEIESQVRTLRCVGSLGRWKRDYRYDFRGPKINTTMILFVFTPAEGKPGRNISRPHETYDVPSGEYRLVAGTYDTRRKTTKVEQCGDLADGSVP